MVNTENQNKSLDAQTYIDQLVEKADKAETQFREFNQDQVDKIIQAMALAGSEAALTLAHEAVEETGRGVVEDKDTKNRFATENVYNDIKNEKTVGVISRDPVKGQVKIAAPLGILAALVPTTNPTSTTLFKSLIAMKTRNAIIFSFHPKANSCSQHAARIVYEAALKAGAPENIIQWIDQPTMDKTSALIQHPKIASILATGGAGMVKAALQSGNPSMGVGAGNGAVYIDHTADINRAVEDLLLSKRFDNGMICATENSAVVEAPVYDQWMARMQEEGAYLLPREDYKKLADFVFNDQHGVNGPVAGMTARWIADNAGVFLPEDKDVILFELDKENIGEKLSSEKLSPLLSVYKVKDRQEGIEVVQDLLNYQGAGHNAGIQIGSQDDPFIDEFADALPSARILVNQPDAIGGIGDYYTDAMRPSLTLGTGSWGKNSLSHNLTTTDLLNIKTVAKRRNRPQWIRLPERIYYEENSISYLQDEPDLSRVFVVTDEGMMATGLAQKALDQLEARSNPVKVKIYSEVKPDPPLSQTIEAAKLMHSFKPDTILAVGGGSPLDAAKIARYIYEVSLDRGEEWLDDYDAVNELFYQLQQKFLDIRKRVVTFKHQTATKLICVPTTAGTGSEVTPFAVITDDKKHVKYPLTDYELTPQVAIIDAKMSRTTPKRTVANSGVDTLCHAIESYVSVMASDYTRPWALKAIQLVFENLETSYKFDPANPTREGEAARNNMATAATLAGMSFANAFLGINHSLAHKIGGAFNLPHGLCIGIAMQPTIRFNGVSGKVKRTPYPRYEVYRAQSDYATIARSIGLEGKDDADLVDKLCQRIDQLLHNLDIDPHLSGNGVSREDFDAALDEMVDLVYDDQCTTCNPRQPSLEEIRQLLEEMY